jgi:hypothetical protein
MARVGCAGVAMSKTSLLFALCVSLLRRRDSRTRGKEEGTGPGVRVTSITCSIFLWSSLMRSLLRRPQTRPSNSVSLLRWLGQAPLCRSCPIKVLRYHHSNSSVGEHSFFHIDVSLDCRPFPYSQHRRARPRMEWATANRWCLTVRAQTSASPKLSPARHNHPRRVPPVPLFLPDASTSVAGPQPAMSWYCPAHTLYWQL